MERCSRRAASSSLGRVHRCGSTVRPILRPQQTGRRLLPPSLTAQNPRMSTLQQSWLLVDLHDHLAASSLSPLIHPYEERMTAATMAGRVFTPDESIRSSELFDYPFHVQPFPARSFAKSIFLTCHREDDGVMWSGHDGYNEDGAFWTGNGRYHGSQPREAAVLFFLGGGGRSDGRRSKECFAVSIFAASHSVCIGERELLSSL